MKQAANDLIIRMADPADAGEIAKLFCEVHTVQS